MNVTTKRISSAGFLQQMSSQVDSVPMCRIVARFTVALTVDWGFVGRDQRKAGLMLVMSTETVSPGLEPQPIGRTG